MAQKKKIKNDYCCAPMDSMGCCKVEALIGVDERGQMVLPKEIRDRAKIKPGDKLAVMTWKTSGKICCLVLIKADEFSEMAKNILGPLIKDLS